jgi:hypothetical protein
MVLKKPSRSSLHYNFHYSAPELEHSISAGSISTLLKTKPQNLVAPGRVELPTFGLGNRCSIHLSYGAVGC